MPGSWGSSPSVRPHGGRLVIWSGAPVGVERAVQAHHCHLVPCQEAPGQASACAAPLWLPGTCHRTMPFHRWRNRLPVWGSGAQTPGPGVPGPLPCVLLFQQSRVPGWSLSRSFILVEQEPRRPQALLCVRPKIPGSHSQWPVMEQLAPRFASRARFQASLSRELSRQSGWQRSLCHRAGVRDPRQWPGSSQAVCSHLCCARCQG